MSTQMSLDEYKKKVEACLKKQLPNTAEWAKMVEGYLTRPDEAWAVYLRDFSPEVTAYGMVSGLI